MPNEIQKSEPQQQLSMHDQMAFAQAVSDGSMLPQAYRRQPANVMIAVGLGQSMGLSPAESLYRINVIGGKPTAGAELIAANVRKAGHKLRIKKDEKNMSVTAEIVRADDPGFTFSVTRDKAWAQQMGLLNKDNYKKQPLTMLMWRAVTAVAREACPEALYGVSYTSEEMADAAPEEPLQAEAVVQDAPAPEQPRDTRYLDGIRSLVKPWAAAKGLGMGAAVSDLCGSMGVASMTELTEQQAQDLERIMRSDVEAAEQQHEEREGAMYDEDVSF